LWSLFGGKKSEVINYQKYEVSDNAHLVKRLYKTIMANPFDKKSRLGFLSPERFTLKGSTLGHITFSCHHE
jgi:hypothetical protein